MKFRHRRPRFQLIDIKKKLHTESFLILEVNCQIEKTTTTWINFKDAKKKFDNRCSLTCPEKSDDNDVKKFWMR